MATHIVGGEIYYDCLGGNNYRVTLKVYRDCYTGMVGFDDPAYIFIYDGNGTYIQEVAIPFPGSVTLPPIINSPCFTPPSNACVEEAVYQTIVNLPPTPSGYNITYQRCCRNNTILNLISPGDVGATYMAHIPGSALACNSSARYNNFPPIFLCSGAPLVFDHSATDPDGDSLYYELCDPFNGLSPDCPSLGPTASPPCSAIADPPPYPLVPWAAPYDSFYPMSASPALAIHPVTGLMTGTPNMIGQWVVGVCVSEYRAGVLLDVSKRDFQFNVVDCPGLPVASIPMQTVFCFGNVVNFTQNSLNAFTYHWDFGDPTSSLDTSNIYAPTWTYADTGVYNVTLIINPGSPCSDTTVNTFYIYPPIVPSFVPPPAQCLNGNSYDFTAGGAYLGNGTFSWNFGSQALTATSNAENPSDIVFSSSGVFPVTFTVSENGCTESYTGSVEVYETPVAEFTTQYDINCYMTPVQFYDSSACATSLTYEWDFDDGTGSTLQNPVCTYGALGTYDVTLIITSANGCKDTTTLPTPLNILPPPVADFSVSTYCFSYEADFTETGFGASTYYWDFGDPSVTSDFSGLAAPSWTYPDSGTYNVMLVINPASGCTDTVMHSFYMNKLLAPELATQAGECVYNNSFDFTPGGSYAGNGTFSWDFGSHATPSASSLETQTNVVFDSAASYTVYLTISENGCTITDSTVIVIHPKPEAGFEIDAVFGCALQPVHFIDVSSSATPLTYFWNFGNGTTSSAANPWATYTDPGNYYITQIVTSMYGCKDTFSYPAALIVYPSPVAGFSITPNYTTIYYPDVAMTNSSYGGTGCDLFWGDGTSAGCDDTIHAYTVAGTYTLMQIIGNEFGCFDTAYQRLIVDPNYSFWLPNAFTPGHPDGLNDVFKPSLIGVHDYEFMIFDRWGEKIFETTDLAKGWDGYYQGHLCKQDVYVYKITFRDDLAGIRHKYIGGVTLLR